MDADADPPFDPNRYVFTIRVRCPVCKAADPRALRGKIGERDGSFRRWSECTVCQHRFFVVIEEPEDCC